MLLVDCEELSRFTSLGTNGYNTGFINVSTYIFLVTTFNSDTPINFHVEFSSDGFNTDTTSVFSDSKTSGTYTLLIRNSYVRISYISAVGSNSIFYNQSLLSF